MSEILTPAVVLRTRALRESDLIVVLLTPGRGKVDCIARGARRSRRRFPGGLPVGARGEVGLDRGRGSLAVLDSFTPSFDHSGLGRDLEAFAYVAYLCELSDQLVGGSAPDPTTFGRLCEAIEDAMTWAGQPETHKPALLRRYELGLLDSLGLLPALDQCSVCGAAANVSEDGVAFSAARGGVACPVHASGARRLPVAVRDLATTLLHADPEARDRAYAQAEREIRRGLRDLCRELIQPHLRAPLRSLAFFAQIATRHADKGSSDGANCSDGSE
ncbi:DNA recombination and repair protein RecO [Enhygromyxa salina]|uniref:DNA repair protein RecO n=1 Tax=Enhygromyxa salina TaxID=215803 RepID=A0A0C2CQ86_9BACT|nr:DNA repair protein RecO [Enhygromyxa salina]KIG13351.1 DNA recombination and repair protein RecO [Enhygromyxa salina]